MISLICGYVSEISGNQVTILTESGVGYLVWCANSLLQNVAANSDDASKITAHIQTIVKEDEISLYGFSNTIEREWFNKFLNVQGVGAKMALLIINSLDASKITESLMSKNHSIFQQVNGIGPKLARRIVNEVNIKDLPGSYNTSSNIQTLNNSIMLDAESALISLGFGKQDVKLVLSKIPNSVNTDSVEELIKYSLGALTEKK